MQFLILLSPTKVSIKTISLMKMSVGVFDLNVLASKGEKKMRKQQRMPLWQPRPHTDFQRTSLRVLLSQAEQHVAKEERDEDTLWKAVI